MATAGGVLVYGVDEDGARLPVAPYPFPGLQAACERIDQVVAQSLSGPPSIRFSRLALVEGGDEGFLVVEVPPSPWAPHMVLRTRRYYGRTETGNRPLEDHEIEQLFARRGRWYLERDQLLDDAIARIPLPPGLRGEVEGTAVVVCRPVLPDPGLLDRRRARPDEPPAGPDSTFASAIDEAARRARNAGQWRHDLTSMVDWTPSPRGGFRGSTIQPGYDGHRRQLLILEIDGDGTITVFSAAAVATIQDRGLLVEEGLIALVCAQACALSGMILGDGGYAGPVDVAVHVDGLGSAVSYERHGPGSEYYGPRRPYGEERFREHRRFNADHLANDPIGAVRALVRPLTRVTAGESWDPMGMVAP